MLANLSFCNFRASQEPDVIVFGFNFLALPGSRLASILQCPSLMLFRNFEGGVSCGLFLLSLASRFLSALLGCVFVPSLARAPPVRSSSASTPQGTPTTHSLGAN